MAHCNIGLALTRKADYDGALAAFREAIRLKADYASAHASIGWALTQKGSLDEAFAALKHALALKPDDAGVQGDVAWFLASGPDPKFRDPKRALELAEKAVPSTSTDPGGWATLGMARCRVGDWKGGVAAAERARALRPSHDPERSFDFLILAMAHGRLQDKDRARKWYDQAVQQMEKTRRYGEVLRSLRAEVAELLGVKVKKD